MRRRPFLQNELIQTPHYGFAYNLSNKPSFIPFQLSTKEINLQSVLGSRKQINTQRLRRVLVRLQGAPKGAYCIYVTFGTTPRTDQKTSKIVDLFISEALKPLHAGNIRQYDR